ncbi:MAG TPA: polysaccharide biosynthesis/export family protein [Pirellulales bacterium]|nr:polysaccharide biosynthesis/export family protein [Pirellulales bacterium]
MLAAALLCVVASGCAALTNPLANGIPVRLVPPELLNAGPPRESLHTLPLSLLGQKSPDVYRLAPKDVLGVYVEGVLPVTNPDEPAKDPPVYFPSDLDPRGGTGAGLPPVLGFPMAIREDGTVALPMIDPLVLNGKSVMEATDAIREAYIKKGILLPGRERIIVGLMQPRQTRVRVVRQEVGGFNVTPSGFMAISQFKRGVGQNVTLRAYENDVLTVLTSTGGLPGLDVYDRIIIFKQAKGNAALEESLENLPLGQDPLAGENRWPRVIQISTRVVPGWPLSFKPEDVILDDGDVVFLESRAMELYYTGGLLPSGEQVLPRDYDLDVVEAVMKVSGSLNNGGLAGLPISPVFGGPSPSLLTVLRRTPNGGQVPIFVDLRRALRDPRERILVQAGDVLVLQETRGQAIARAVQQTFALPTSSYLLTTGVNAAQAQSGPTNTAGAAVSAVGSGL